MIHPRIIPPNVVSPQDLYPPGSFTPLTINPSRGVKKFLPLGCFTPRMVHPTDNSPPVLSPPWRFTPIGGEHFLTPRIFHPSDDTPQGPLTPGCFPPLTIHPRFFHPTDDSPLIHSLRKIPLLEWYTSRKKLNWIMNTIFVQSSSSKFLTKFKINIEQNTIVYQFCITTTKFLFH